MDRSHVPHNEADLSPTASDPISGLYTAIPNITVPGPKEAGGDTTAGDTSIRGTRLELLLLSAAIVPMGFAVATLIGWALDVDRLRTVLPGHAPMKPNTAIGIGLCGLALLLARKQGTRRLWTELATAAVAGALIVGSLTGIQFIFGLELGIDDLLIPEHHRVGELVYAGRMSPATALTLTLTAVSILLSLKRYTRLPIPDLAAVAVAILALVSILGYVFNAPSLYSMTAFRSVAMGTAFSFFLLAIGSIFIRGDGVIAKVFLDRGPAGSLVRRLVPAAVGIPIISGWLVLEGLRLKYFDFQFGLASLGAFNILVLTYLVWRSAQDVKDSNDQVAVREEHLRRSREHLELALEAGEIAAWDVDLSTQQIKRTPRYDHIMGYDPPPDEWTLADFARHIHPDDRERYTRIVEERIFESGDRPIELRMVRPNGEIRTIWSMGRRIAADEHGHARMAGVMMDITEQRRAQEELRQIFERITDAFVAVDNNFNFTYVNSKAASMLQREPNDLLGNNMWDEFPEGLATGFRGAYERAFRQQIPVVHEEHYKPLGIWIQIRVFPSADGLSIYFHDVTERRTAEDRIRQLNESLENRVAERTRELENVNRELESFSYSVSHDLRAPLRAIDGFSSAVVEDFGSSLAPEALEYLGRVRNASKQMGLLIDNLLKLSRVSRAEMKRNEIDLSDLATRAVERLRETGSKHIVDVTIAPGVKAFGDEVLVGAVLENLIGNAWKFTSKTDGARIEFGKTERNGESMYFVSDNGAGFAMQYRDKLFGAFQRLHSLAEFEGTGVGLATVQRIVNRHGGRVDAEGSVGNGATFYFSLGDSKGNAE